MSDDKIYQNEEGKKLFVKEDDLDEDDDNNSGGGGDKKDEDDDQNFIKKDEDLEAEEKRSEVFQGIKKDLDIAAQGLETAKNGGIRPEGNQQRNLDRETGGLEAEQDKGISEKDAWDDRGEEVQEMISDGEDLNNASKSSRAQGFIHVDKQRKRKSKKHHEEMVEASGGYAAQVMKWRSNKEDGLDRGGNGGGGRVM